MSIRDYLSTLRRRWLVVVVCVFLCAGGLGVAGALVLAQGEQSTTPVGKDTPSSGDRWQVAALA